MSSRRDLAAIVLALGALAVAVRLVSVALLMREPIVLYDPTLYLASARSIAAGHGYATLLGHPSAYYPPGYPYFLGIVLWMLERVGAGSWHLAGIGALQALFGGITTAATVIAGARIFDRRTGVIAGLLVALWPNLILYAALLLSESLFLAVFSVTLVALLAVLDDTSGSVRKRVLLAAAVALGVWIRPQSILPAVAVCCVALPLAGIGWRRIGAAAGTLVAGVLVAVLPWTARNAVVMGAFVPFTTSAGDNMCIGFHDGATGSFRSTPECAPSQGFDAHGPAAEVLRDSELRARAMAWIRANPRELPIMSLRKLRDTFQRDMDAAYALEGYGAEMRFTLDGRALVHGVSDYYYYVVGLLALLGGVIVAARVAKARRLDTGPALLLAFLASGVLAPVLFFGDYRFKVPIMPCVAILSAVTIGTAAARLRAR